MKKVYIIFLFSFLVTLLANAQNYFNIDCEWDSRDLITMMVRWDYEDQEEPEMWKEFPNAHHIRWVAAGGWQLPAPNGGSIHPTYIIFKNEEPTIFGTCELAYNYFVKYPKVVETAVAKGKRLEYRHKDFIVIVEYVPTRDYKYPNDHLIKRESPPE